MIPSCRNHFCVWWSNYTTLIIFAAAYSTRWKRYSITCWRNICKNRPCNVFHAMLAQVFLAPRLLQLSVDSFPSKKLLFQSIAATIRCSPWIVGIDGTYRLQYSSRRCVTAPLPPARDLALGRQATTDERSRFWPNVIVLVYLLWTRRAGSRFEFPVLFHLVPVAVASSLHQTTSFSVQW